MQTYSLLQLNEFIRRSIALNFPESIWVKAEIAQIKESKGHWYMTLVEKDQEGTAIIAQSEAVIWRGDLTRNIRKQGSIIAELLREGVELLMKVRVDYHEKFGFKLILEEVDPTFTIGKWALERQKIIAQLQQLQLLDRNKSIPLPYVVQRIAVISSETAAGLQDFWQHLNENEYQYHFQTHLFQSAVQGIQVEKEMVSQLNLIREMADSFDCVVIIRGGGSRTDLAAFDNFELCKTVANFPLPVFTGIGHDVDQTALDLVSHQSLKTPTAVADFILHHNLQFEFSLNEVSRFLQKWVEERFLQEERWIDQSKQEIFWQNNNRIKDAHFQLEQAGTSIQNIVSYRLHLSLNQLDHLEQQLGLLRPESVLKRGFSLSIIHGKVISHPDEAKKGDEMTTYLDQGSIISIVQK